MSQQSIRMLRMKQTEDRTGMGRTTITQLEKQGLFPKRVRLTKHSSGFVESEVEDWLEGRKKLRDLNDPQLLENDRVLNADLKRGATA
jgi:prophage regulatory protein